MIFTTLSRSGGVHPSFSSSSHDDSAALSQQQTKSRSLLFGQFLSSVHLLLSRFTASAFRGRIEREKRYEKQEAEVGRQHNENGIYPCFVHFDRA